MTSQPQQNAAPGSTAYYTLPNIGGFYAPVSRNEPVGRHVDSSDYEDDGGHRTRKQVPLRAAMPPPPVYGQSHPMHPFMPPPAHPPQAWTYPGASMPAPIIMPGQPPSRFFNGWKGIPETKDPNEKGKPGKTEKIDKKEKKKKKKPKVSEPAVSPWHQLADSLRKRSEHRHRRKHVDDDSEGYSDDDVAYDYDSCDSPVRRGHSSPQDQVMFSESADVKVIIQPYGSARVIVHISDDEHDEHDGDEKMVAFVVSDRCLQTAAKEWPDQCHAGTRTCSIRVGCDEAVIGMYWMLHVLHHAGRDSTIQNSLVGQQRDRQFQQQVTVQKYLQQRAEAQSQSPHDGIADHFVYDYYHGCVGTRAVPIELPPRVLAFALMYAVQFGVLEAWQPAQPAQISRMQASIHGSACLSSEAKGAAPSAAVSDPAANLSATAAAASDPKDAFRQAASQWMQSIAGTLCNITADRLNSVTVPPGDILFVLYAGRVLGSAPVIRLCQLTILDRWSVGDTVNWFRDGCGRPVRAGDILPSPMAEAVSLDLISLKSARVRSLSKVADLATRLHDSMPAGLRDPVPQ